MSEEEQVVRPKTRGELRDLLKAGKRCEVAASAAEMTNLMLRGWLGFDKFTVSKSDNPGWVIYTPGG